jgi:hypothetical protein
MVVEDLSNLMEGKWKNVDTYEEIESYPLFY